MVHSFVEEALINNDIKKLKKIMKKEDLLKSLKTDILISLIQTKEENILTLLKLLSKNDKEIILDIIGISNYMYFKLDSLNYLLDNNLFKFYNFVYFEPYTKNVFWVISHTVSNNLKNKEYEQFYYKFLDKYFECAKININRFQPFYLMNEAMIFNEEFNDYILKKIPESLYECFRYTNPLTNSVNFDNKKLFDYIVTKIIETKTNIEKFEGISPIVVSLSNQKDYYTKRLLEFDNLDLDVVNYEGKYPCHLCFKGKRHVKIIRDILLRTTNLNNKEPNKGHTSIHYVFCYDLFDDVKDILKLKVINLFIKDKSGKMPIEFIKKERITEVMGVVLRGIQQNYNINNSKEMTKMASCLINFTRSCYNKIEDYSKNLNKKEIDFNMPEKVFNSNYTAYSKVRLISFKYFHDKYKIPLIKSSHNEFEYENKSEFLTQNGIISHDGRINLGRFNYLNKKLFNTEILIFDERNYIYSSDLVDEIKKIKNGITYINVGIFFIDDKNSHANILIIDIDKKKIIHFEPQIVRHDNRISETLKNITESLKFKFINCKDYVKDYNLQELSFNDMKYFFEPNEYCQAWCHWFFEMYINNKNMNLKKLLEQSKESIIDNNFTFLEFIRSYAAKLTKFSIDYFNSIKVPVDTLFKPTFDNDLLDHIENSIADDIF